MESYDKWRKICDMLAELSKPPVDIPAWLRRHEMPNSKHWFEIYVRGSCSYCDEFMKDAGDRRDYPDDKDISILECSLCPLFEAKACASTWWRSPGFRFWLLETAIMDERWRDAHIHAVKILEAIENTKEEVIDDD